MNWDIFALLYNLIATPVLSSVDTMAGALSGAVAPALRWGLMVALAGLLLWRAVKPGGAEPFGEVVGLLLAGAVALYVVSSAAGYGPYVRDVLIRMPQEIGQTVAGGTGGRPLDASAFSDVWRKAWAAGLGVWRNIPPSIGSIPLYAIVVIFWFVALAATVLAFVIWLKAFVFLALLVGIGPLFAGLFAFSWTRGWFYGWLNTAMANVVLQILSVALLALLVSATTEMLAQVFASMPAPLAAAPSGTSILRQYIPGRNAPANTENEVMQVATLLAGVVLFGVAGWLAYQLPGTAAAITHGFAGYATQAGRHLAAMAGPLTGLGGRFAPPGGARAGAWSQPAAAPARALPAPGPSLSNP